MPSPKIQSVKPRLKEEYDSKFRAQLQKDLKLDNIHQVPSVEKITLNIGMGRNKDDKRAFEVAENTLTKISGQKPVETMAKKSIANFKLREGQRIGLKVTLRGAKMYEFLDRLINVVLPRVRDFRGVSTKSFDPQGNYSMGIDEQSVFPELGFADVSMLHGLQVSIVTSTNNKEHAYALLKSFGMPFDDKEKK